MKTVSLGDFLTDEEIKRAISMNDAKQICEEVIKPNLDRINQQLGGENNPMFLAYAVLYVASQVNSNASPSQ